MAHPLIWIPERKIIREVHLKPLRSFFLHKQIREMERLRAIDGDTARFDPRLAKEAYHIGDGTTWGWKKPAGLSFVFFLAIGAGAGGGAGGGSSAAGNQVGGGAGGGSGAVTRGLIPAVMCPDQIWFTAGVGGAAGAGVAGGTGGTGGAGAVSVISQSHVVTLAGADVLMQSGAAAATAGAGGVNGAGAAGAGLAETIYVTTNGYWGFTGLVSIAGIAGGAGGNAGAGGSPAWVITKPTTGGAGGGGSSAAGPAFAGGTVTGTGFYFPTFTAAAALATNGAGNPGSPGLYSPMWANLWMACGGMGGGGNYGSTSASTGGIGGAGGLGSGGGGGGCSGNTTTSGNTGGAAGQGGPGLIYIAGW